MQPYLVGVISEAIKPALRTAAAASAGFLTIAAQAQDSLPILSQTLENATTSSPIDHYYTPDDSINTQFKALQYSLFSTSFVEVLGGVFFFICAAYILKDKKTVEQAVAGKNPIHLC